VEGEATTAAVVAVGLTIWFSTFDVAVWKFEFEGVNVATIVCVPAVASAAVQEGAAPFTKASAEHSTVLLRVSV
jgi:hypothetical protein